MKVHSQLCIPSYTTWMGVSSLTCISSDQHHTLDSSLNMAVVDCSLQDS